MVGLDNKIRRVYSFCRSVEGIALTDQELYDYYDLFVSRNENGDLCKVTIQQPHSKLHDNSAKIVDGTLVVEREKTAYTRMKTNKNGAYLEYVYAVSVNNWHNPKVTKHTRTIKVLDGKLEIEL